MSMKNVIYCLLCVIAISACSTNKYKAAVPRLTTIGIKGDSIPQYTFHYDAAGNLQELVHHQQFNDTNVSTFFYDSSHRITGMTLSSRDTNTSKVQERAKVTAWDHDGNVTAIQYFDAEEHPLRTASIRWKKGLPEVMKYSDSTQAISWNYKQGNPEQKDICRDTFAGKQKDTLITLRTAHYEWDDSINPMRPILNQLLISHAVTPAIHLSPMGNLNNAFLHLSTNNPSLVKITEKEKSIYQQHFQEYERSTVVQYTYNYNGNGYPTGAWVHVHSEGFTKQDIDTEFIMEYRYE